MSIANLLSGLGQRTWRSPLAFAAVWVPSLTMFIVSFDPSLTSAMPIHLQITFWVLHVALLLPLLLFVQSVVDNLLAVTRVPSLLMFALAAFCASVIFAPVSLAMDAWFEPVPDLGPDPALGWLLFDETTSLLMPTLCIWLLVNGARLQRLSVPLMNDTANSSSRDNASDHNRYEDNSNESASTAIEHAFWSKMPKSLGRNIVSLTAEQHYLHVTTTMGRSMILFPIGRAIEALASYQGVQIHRSHWVAIAHIVDVERSTDSATAVLSNAQRLPVSRRNRAKLKQVLASSGGER